MTMTVTMTVTVTAGLDLSGTLDLHVAEQAGGFNNNCHDSGHRSNRRLQSNNGYARVVMGLLH